MPKKPPKRPSQPKPRPPGPKYRFAIALALALLFSFAPACGGDGAGEAEEAALCAGLAAAAGYHLLELGCALDDVDLAADFAIACFLGDPSEEEAVACLSALYALDECPDELPTSCASFLEIVGPGLDVTTVAQDMDAFWTPIAAAPYPMGGASLGQGSTDPGDTDWHCRPCDPPPGPNATGARQDSWPIYSYPGE